MSLKHFKDYHGSPKPITEAALHRALQGEISAVRKVYDAVPINELWNVTQIIAELRRVGVTNMGLTHVAGTCQLLSAKGVIKEIGVKNYIRVPVIPVSKKKRTTINESETKVMTQNKNKSQKPAAECAIKRASATLLTLAAELEGLSIPPAGPSLEQQEAIAELIKERDEARRIGEGWNKALAAEKEKHEKSLDRLHEALGKIERLEIESAKFAQLKLLLNGGL